MQKKADWQDELAALARRLGELGPLTHGTVQDRGHGAGGPVYQWTATKAAKRCQWRFRKPSTKR